MFDIGGSVGSIMAGLMSDIINAGGITCIIFLLMAIPSVSVNHIYIMNES